MIDLTELAREINIDDCYQQEMIDMREDIPIQVIESLVKVIGYLFADEQEHYNNCEMEDKDDHIFSHLTRVNEWFQTEIIDYIQQQPSYSPFF